LLQLKFYECWEYFYFLFITSFFANRQILIILAKNSLKAKCNHAKIQTPFAGTLNYSNLVLSDMLYRIKQKDKRMAILLYDRCIPRLFLCDWTVRAVYLKTSDVSLGIELCIFCVYFRDTVKVSLVMNNCSSTYVILE